MVKRSVLVNVNSDRGFDSLPGYEVKLPDCQSSLETHRQRMLDFAVTGRIFGRRADVAHPRPGSFGSPRSPNRIDFCENAVLNHSDIKAFLRCGTTHWITGCDTS
jgi:hypothetical protein